LGKRYRCTLHHVPAAQYCGGASELGLRSLLCNVRLLKFVGLQDASPTLLKSRDPLLTVRVRMRDDYMITRCSSFSHCVTTNSTKANKQTPGGFDEVNLFTIGLQSGIWNRGRRPEGDRENVLLIAVSRLVAPSHATYIPILPTNSETPVKH